VFKNEKIRPTTSQCWLT